MTREDGAPAGTSYKCYICGGETRKPFVNRKHKYEGSPGLGEYVPGVGVKHKTEKECQDSLNSIQPSRAPYNRDPWWEDATDNF